MADCVNANNLLRSDKPAPSLTVEIEYAPVPSCVKPLVAIDMGKRLDGVVTTVAVPCLAHASYWLLYKPPTVNTEAPLMVLLPMS